MSCDYESLSFGYELFTPYWLALFLDDSEPGMFYCVCYIRGEKLRYFSGPTEEERSLNRREKKEELKKPSNTDSHLVSDFIYCASQISFFYKLFSLYYFYLYLHCNFVNKYFLLFIYH